MAYPRKNPKVISKGAGISLPVDLKEMAKAKAASKHRSLSSIAADLFRNWLEETSDTLKASGNKDFEKAANVKKRR